MGENREPKSEQKEPNKRGFFGNFGRIVADAFSGKGVLDVVDRDTPEGKAFTTTVSRLAGQWKVKFELMKKAAEVVADLMIKEDDPKVNSALTEILQASGLKINPSTYEQERRNLLINLQGISSVVRERNSKFGSMFNTIPDDDNRGGNF